MQAYANNKSTDSPARTPSADFLDELEALSLEELATAEPLIEGSLEVDGEAQAIEAQFDGADGEAAPFADFQDELEDLSLEA